MIGQTLGHYRIDAKLGEGAMGVVYRAHDEQLDRDVAIKVLPAGSFRDATARARLLREARTASKLNHPHICTIHEVGEADGQAYIAMELVEGQSLSARLAGGALPVEQVLRYGLQLADALAHAHERGIIHRDLKSANVIITPEGRAKVLDFGLAKRLSGEQLAEATTQTMDSLTGPGAVVGTLAYMAPEQLRGQPADARSDVWALGVVLYEMAAGQRPFQGQTGFELSSAILSQPPAPLRPGPSGALPAELGAVIARCLEKEPAQRYQRSRRSAGRAGSRSVRRPPSGLACLEVRLVAPPLAGPGGRAGGSRRSCGGAGCRGPARAAAGRGRDPAVSLGGRLTVGESLRRSPAGLLRRRDARCADHRLGQAQRPPAGDRPLLGNAVPEDRQAAAADRAGIGRGRHHYGVGGAGG